MKLIRNLLEEEFKEPTGYEVDIEDETIKNKDFRRVLYTTKHNQLVLMSLKPGEDIGSEVHPDISQFFRIEKGTGQVVLGEKTIDINDGDAAIVPAGTNHNIINNSETEDLKLYTIYSPPRHVKGTVHKTKADVTEEKFDGETDL